VFFLPLTATYVTFPSAPETDFSTPWGCQHPRLRNTALKQIFIQCKIYLRGNTNRQQLKMINKMLTVPLEKFLRTPMSDRFLSLSFFRAFTHCKLFVSFRSLNIRCKINRINPLIVIISSKLPAIANVMHKLLWVLQTIPNDN